MVLFAPITAPYCIFKSRKEAGIALFMTFLTTFTAVIIIEGILYAKYREKNKYASLPPVTRQMLRLSDNVKKTTIQTLFRTLR
ncbi:MAG: hypothetical protein GY729_17350, partial [Desulfobacteraceae bacterium]|nr:hypothetical protein [Desulfobacteraceae bacterium]